MVDIRPGASSGLDLRADRVDVDVERLAALLGRAAAWQGLDEVEVVPRGDLADELGPAVTASGSGSIAGSVAGSGSGAVPD